MAQAGGGCKHVVLRAIWSAWEGGHGWIGQQNKFQCGFFTRGCSNDSSFNCFANELKLLTAVCDAQQLNVWQNPVVVSQWFCTNSPCRGSGNGLGSSAPHSSSWGLLSVSKVQDVSLFFWLLREDFCWHSFSCSNNLLTSALSSQCCMRNICSTFVIQGRWESSEMVSCFFETQFICRAPFTHSR